jgi:hypothetical protein
MDLKVVRTRDLDRAGFPFRTYKLSETVEAMRYFERRPRSGKIVIKVE